MHSLTALTVVLNTGIETNSNAMRIEPLLSIDEENIREAFNAAFQDYLIGAYKLTSSEWREFLQRQQVHLALSRVAIAMNGELAAFALIADRAAHWRLATMGAPPAHRGSGAAQALLQDLFVRAKQAGKTKLELEVFAQNERAVRLYRSHGFNACHDLLGFRWDPSLDTPSHTTVFTDLTRDDAIEWIATHEPAQLPMQMSASSLRANPRPWRAWRNQQAQLVFREEDKRVVLVNLLDRSATQNDTIALARSLQNTFSTLLIVVPELLRADLGGNALLAAGFRRSSFHQLLMEREV